jgi:hypothetical protein
MKRYTDQVLSQVTGLPMLGARVTVNIAGSNMPARIYAVDDETSTQAANPFTASSSFSFYAPDGRYDIIVTVGGRTSTLPNVELVDLLEIIRRLEAIENGEPGAPGSLRADLLSSTGAGRVMALSAGVGAQSRSLQTILQDEPFNPRDFGATGDAQPHYLRDKYANIAAARLDYPFLIPVDEYGTPWGNQTLDSMAIDAALNAASSNENVRGTVVLPLGYYVLSKPIKMPSFVTFYGVSRYGCVLYNQVTALNAPQLVNKDPAALVFSTFRNLTFFGGTHAIKINVTAETASLVFDGVTTGLQSVTVIEATSLQATVFRDCQFGTSGSGWAVNVTGFPCNAVEFYNCRLSSGKSGVLRLRGFDGVHWYGGSMEGNGRSLKTTGSIDGFVMTVTALNSGIGPISPGDAVVGDGVTPGTVVLAGGSGTGGAGTYNLSLHSVASSRPLVIGPATIDLEAGGTRATSCTFNGLYFEGTPALLLRSIGTSGVSFDACKHTFATDGDPYFYDTGADIVAIGTNYFDKDVIGPLNTLMFGHTPKMGGNVNTWTSLGQNTSRVVTRQKSIVNGVPVDLLIFNRPTGTGSAANRHLISGTLTVLAEGFDAGGSPRSINRTYRVLVQAVSNSSVVATVTQTDTQDNVSAGAPQTLTVRVKANPGITELRIETLGTNFEPSLPSSVSAIFEGGGRPTQVSDMMRLAVA